MVKSGGVLTCIRWELAVAYDVYIGNESGSNIGAQTFKVCRLTITYQYIYDSVK